MTQLEYSIQDDWSGMVISYLLRKKLDFSAALMHTLRETEGSFILDGQAVPHYTAVRPGQKLVVRLPDDPPSAILPASRSLNIIYEDAHLIILSKDAGVVVHPGPNHHNDTVGNFLMEHYLQEGEHHLFRPINRLDKGTSGLMCVAKHAYAADRLRSMLHSQNFNRCYFAICHGIPKAECGLIEAPIGRKEGSVIEREVRPDGKYALTEYRVLQTAGKNALLQVSPKTGRAHQIRVHLAHIGHPLVGDFLYGTESPLITRTALHSASLTLRHPVTNEIMTFETPMPADMQALLKH